jgi:hypothetical protein
MSHSVSALPLRNLNDVFGEIDGGASGIAFALEMQLLGIRAKAA